MKQKTVFSVLLCCCILFFITVFPAAADSESDIYVFDINQGDLFISKSPLSDYRSAGDFLQVISGIGWNPESDFVGDIFAAAGYFVKSFVYLF